MNEFTVVAWSNYSTGPAFHFIHRPANSVTYSLKGQSLVLWGDYILPDGKESFLAAKLDIDNLVKLISGHYYFLLQDFPNRMLYVGNSLFSILPIYFRKQDANIYFSNNPLKLTASAKINKRFILENILFNYPIFNQSCFEDVSLLPTNNYFQIGNDGVGPYQHTAIENYFVSCPKPWRKSAPELSDAFIDITKKYLPDEPYTSSLTGGFDGRTLAACSLYYNKKFNAYCFGSAESRDVEIAEQLARVSGIDFNKVNLDENFVKKYSLKYGLDFILGSAGGGSFARSHYLYAAQILSSKTRYLVSGNFGSEIFRAFHIEGVMVNANLRRIFTSSSFDAAVSQLSKAKELSWLKLKLFTWEWQSLLEDIKTLPCFNRIYLEYTPSQKFYIFIFNEVFRKYFGAEIVNQFKYFSNRTPFLDFNFLTQLLQTELAGVYSDFYEHNPIKRFKGQVLYSHIIRKAYPAFGKIITDKGYKPDDLMSHGGKVQVTKSYFKKRIFKKKGIIDPYAVNAAFNNNYAYFHNQKFDEEFFCKKMIRYSIENLQNTDNLSIALSQVYWNNYLKNQLDEKNKSCYS